MVYVILAALCLFGFGAVALLRAGQDVQASGAVTSRTLVLMLLGFFGPLALVIVAAARHAWPIPIDPRIGWVGGMLLVAAGAALGLASRKHFTFRRAWGLEFDKLITEGVYRWSRNPQVAGWFLMYAGIAAIGRSGAALVIAGLFMLAFLPWIIAEERALERRFGDEYREYRRRTRRFL